MLFKFFAQRIKLDNIIFPSFGANAIIVEQFLERKCISGNATTLHSIEYVSNENVSSSRIRTIPALFIEILDTPVSARAIERYLRETRHGGKSQLVLTRRGED